VKGKLFYPGLLVCGFFAIRVFADDFYSTTEAVGRITNGLVTPVNQLVTPAGTQIELPHVRPNALALSPDGRLLVTSGLTNRLLVIDPAAGKISQAVAFPPDKVQEEAPDSEENLNTNKNDELSFTGIAFSPKGSRIYLANVNGDIKVFGVGADETVSPLFSIALPLAKLVKRTNEIPAGIAVSRDGRIIYVAGNISNHLFELDAATGNVLPPGMSALRLTTWCFAEIKFTSATGAGGGPVRTVSPDRRDTARLFAWTTARLPAKARCR
jgi:DNA-binding beta-propeller fold protein YncE